MVIYVQPDGRRLEGTATQIVGQLRSLAMDGGGGRSIGEHARWLAEEAQRAERLAIKLSGETDEELAESLIAEMLRVGLASEAPLVDE